MRNIKRIPICLSALFGYRLRWNCAARRTEIRTSFTGWMTISEMESYPMESFDDDAI